MKHIGDLIPRRLLTVSVAILLFAPAAARAAECPESSPEDPQERRRLAKEWFSMAESAENTGSDSDAVRAYACSYKMVAHPFTAFNLARVAERSGDHDLSLKMFKAYLALKPDAKDRDEVKAKIKALEDRNSGDSSETTTGPTETSPEESATATDPTPDVLNPPPEPKPADVVVRRPPEPEPEPEPAGHTLEWVIGGASAAALVGGIVTNFIARAKMDTCRTDADNGFLKKANSECDAARPMAYTSYALLSLAAAGIATDAVIIYLKRRGGGSDSDEEAYLAPVLLPGGAGVLARGRF
jgi:hypothetical protein